MEEIANYLFFPDSNANYLNPQIPYYRARPGENRQFKLTEIFHVPFQLRERVNTQRYSVPGLPCLYLATSTYVCWEELGRPEVDKMQVSRFHPDTFRLKTLDISMTPKSVTRTLAAISGEDFLKMQGTTRLAMLDSWDFLTMSYLMKWPLIAACSIRTKYPDTPFKPEYIFPQFLLQWTTTTQDVQAIKYFSVKANLAGSVDYSDFTNVAIPVKDIAPTWFCKSMVESFSFTHPVSWQMLYQSDPSVSEHNQELFAEVLPHLGRDLGMGVMELIEGRKTFYWRSVFGKLEIHLQKMPLQKIPVSG
jgi:hypothetical protein